MNLQRDFTQPYVDDGLLEVVGFKDAWHGLVLLTPKGHGTRLAQVDVSYSRRKPLIVGLHKISSCRTSVIP